MNRLNDQQITQFIELGYVKIENAFSKELADQCQAILWSKIGLEPDQPNTWTQPVIRIGELDDSPFVQAANTSILQRAYEQLAFDNWLPRTSVGSFPIRFPSQERPMDTGWHVDASFPGDDPMDYLSWRINVNSKGRALLMLFLFSDTSDMDAPTRIKIGSHLDVAGLLDAHGEQGLTFMELAQGLSDLPSRSEINATGPAGTVYLCHPFIVHAAHQHRGATPKFMAQPALLSKRAFNTSRNGREACPIELAIQKGIQRNRCYPM